MTLSVTSNADHVLRRMTDIERRQIPFATARALTWTAKAAAADVTADMDRIFDRPTTFTRRGVGSSPARKTRLTATVFVKRVQAGYLELQETGGVRRPRNRAILMPVGARLNRYGNLPRRAFARLLARPDTFSGSIGGRAGLWQRRKRGGPKLLIAYADNAQYRPRFDFARRVTRSARKTFTSNFNRSLSHALASAR